MIGFSFFLTGEEEEDQVESIQDAFVRSMTLDFELPSNFLHPERYPNVDLADALFSRVPSVVSSALFDAMPESIPIDPQMPFIFLCQSRLPEFVVAWFMAFLPKKRVGRMNRFFSSMNAIEQYREFVFFPPTDPNLYDPIVAAGGALAPALLAEHGQEEEGVSDTEKTTDIEKTSKESGEEDLNRGFVEEDQDKEENL